MRKKMEILMGPAFAVLMAAGPHPGIVNVATFALWAFGAISLFGWICVVSEKTVVPKSLSPLIWAYCAVWAICAFAEHYWLAGFWCFLSVLVSGLEVKRRATKI